MPQKRLVLVVIEDYQWLGDENSHMAIRWPVGGVYKSNLEQTDINFCQSSSVWLSHVILLVVCSAIAF